MNFISVYGIINLDNFTNLRPYFNIEDERKFQVH